MTKTRGETRVPDRRRDNPKLLSFVIPVFCEEAVLPLLKERLLALVGQLPCPVEYVFVDDGSHDRTVAMLQNWALEDHRVKLLEFARNFGHQWPSRLVWTTPQAMRS